MPRTSRLVTGVLIALAVSLFTFGDVGPSPLVGLGPAAASAATFDGPLVVDSSNPRYFTDDSGKAIYLSGSHTWTDLQDRGTTNPPSTFNYDDFINMLTSEGQNFFRMWAWEQVNYVPWQSGDYYFTMNGTGTGVNANSGSPWGRSATVCCAADGGNKFDLNINSPSLFNQAYFDRLASRVDEAYENGIYVDVMLFQGWSVETKSGFSDPGNPWPGHPFDSVNNVNGINGDINDDGIGNEVHTWDPGNTTIAEINALQEAYIAKVVQTLDAYPNVLYEISNEDDGSSAAATWQNEMVDYLKTYEADNETYQHPVGETAGAGSDADLFDSPADWVSPTTNYADSGASAATGDKVVISDTDHIFGQGGDAAWVWESFTRGVNTAYMDDGAALGEGSSDENSARQAMGETVTFSNQIDLNDDVPHGELTSTGYALASPGSEYLVFQPSSDSSFTIDMDAGTYNFEWLDVADNTTSTGELTVGGGDQSFTPPFSGYAVLLLTNTGGGGSPVLGYDGAAPDSFSYSQAGESIVYRFQAGSDATLTDTDMNIESVSSSANVEMAIYADSGGSPGSLLATTSARSGLTSGWQQFALTSPLDVTAGTYYWIGYMSDTGDSDATGLHYYTDETGGSAAYRTGTYPDFGDPFGTPAATWTDRIADFYAEASG